MVCRNEVYIWVFGSIVGSQDLIWCVKWGVYMGFWVHRGFSGPNMVCKNEVYIWVFGPIVGSQDLIWCVKMGCIYVLFFFVHRGFSGPNMVCKNGELHMFFFFFHRGVLILWLPVEV